MQESLKLTFEIETKNLIFRNSLTIEYQSGGYSIFNIQYHSGRN